MSKFSCIVLCVVAASLSSLAAAKEGKPSLHEYLEPIRLECAKEHGVSEAEIEYAISIHSTADLNPCFLGCVSKKAGFLNSQGLYDVESGVRYLSTKVEDKKQMEEFKLVAEKCAVVNDYNVTDGEAGCQRGWLASDCFWQHKDEMDLA